jgi:hypothetical protein
MVYVLRMTADLAGATGTPARIERVAAKDGARDLEVVIPTTDRGLLQDRSRWAGRGSREKPLIVSTIHVSYRKRLR